MGLQKESSMSQVWTCEISTLLNDGKQSSSSPKLSTSMLYIAMNAIKRHPCYTLLSQDVFPYALLLLPIFAYVCEHILHTHRSSKFKGSPYHLVVLLDQSRILL